MAVGEVSVRGKLNCMLWYPRIPSKFRIIQITNLQILTVTSQKIQINLIYPLFLLLFLSAQTWKFITQLIAYICIK